MCSLGWADFCKVVSGMFWLISKAFVSGFYGVLGGFLGHCYVLSSMFRV